MSQACTTSASVVVAGSREEHPRSGPLRRVSAEEGYALWAGSYDRDANPLLRLEERALEHLLPPLAGKAVVDVACGTGRWLEKLLSNGACGGVGLDISSAMLSGAGAKTGLRGRLVRGEFLRLPLRSALADLVVCSFAVNHAADLPALGRELARVARPRADVFVTDLHPLAQAQGWKCAFSEGKGTVVIETLAHPLESIQRAFEAENLDLAHCYEPRLGEPEREIFVRAGKSWLFESACRVRAMFIFHFKKRADVGVAAATARPAGAEEQGELTG